MGVTVVQGAGDSGMNAFRIANHIIVPEANHRIAFSFDGRCSTRVQDLFVLTPRPLQ